MSVVLRRRAFGVACWIVVLFGNMSLASAQVAAAQSQTGSVKSLILPGESFLINERAAFIMWPEESKRRTPQPWVMYSPTLPPYPDQNEKWIHQKLLNAGIAVAGIDIGEAYGSPAGQEGFSDLYNELTKHRGFSARPCLLGRSRGGLWSSSWAASHPTKVAGIAGIYPVFDLTSYPGLERAAPAYGLTEAQLAQSIKKYNPIEKVETLAKAKIPVFIVHGDSDTVVPLEKNSARIQAVYQELGQGELVKLVVAEGQGHNLWSGFFRSQELVDFVIDRAKAGTKPLGRSDFAPDQTKLPVAPPTGAVVLLSESENHFVSRNGTAIDWPNENGVVTSTHGGSIMNHIVSKFHFRDADIHVEFMLPEKGPGNSGIYIHGNYELQILNTHEKEKVTMNDMGALYGFKKASVNAARPPSEWQVYDIRYRAPRRNDKGDIVEAGSVTAFLNGKNVQDSTRFEEPRSSFHPYRHGVTEYLKKIGRIQKQTMTGPVFLQDHNCKVKFRNVWFVPLDDQIRKYEN